MSVIEFLSELAEKDIRLWVEDEKLRFSAPEGAFTDEIKQAVVSRKSELIEFLSQAKRVFQENIPRVDRTQQLPLSYAQERLWFLNKLDPDSAAYNMPASIRIKGNLCVDTLNQVLTEIVRRHEILRTVMLDIDGESFQQINPPGPWTLTLESNVFVQKNGQDFDTQLATLAASEAYTPFNLETGPVLRTRLIQLAKEDYIFLATMHHIASDGWSMGVLVSEIATLYKSYSLKQSSTLPELSVQYADYAAWQKTHTGEEKLTKQLEYWKNKLANVTPLPLATDKPRPALMGHEGNFHKFILDKSLTAKINALGNRHGATLFMTLLAAYSVLLARYSQSEGFCIGTPVANRTHSALEPLIGCFINTLAIQPDLSEDPSFDTLMERMVDTCQQAFSHQDIPFEYVVEQIVTRRDLSSTPLFQAMFILQNMPVDRTVSLPGITMEPIEIGKRIAKCDISLCITEQDDQLAAELEYRSDLFVAETIAQMGRHFSALLHAIVSDPGVAISRLELLTGEERQQLLHDSRPAVTVPAVCVHQLFEKQVAQTPDNIAVACGDTQLTYHELNARSNQLAHYLKAQGLIRGDFVGICLHASTDILVAVLAVIKSGAAYIPMDPNYPEDRLFHMISDAGAQFLISEESLQEKFTRDSYQLLILDHCEEALLSHSSSNPEFDVSTNDTLYVVYTSGSTGKPKGAGVRHRNEVNLLQWYVREYRIDADEKVLIISAFGFDLTQKNLFAALSKGGQVTFVDSQHYDPQIILRAIEDKHISFLNCAPSAFYPLVEQSDNCRQLASLKVVLFGGEPIRMDNLAAWINQPQFACDIVNMYGPTECTDIAASYTIPDPRAFIGRTIPIGSANDNVQLYILDRHDQPVPPGVVGELCIGGAGVGIGYIHNPGMTSEKFFNNPFSVSTGDEKDLLYRSGDLVRRRHDGLLEFVSRVDGQVKIRGFRIELGEIESRMASHPAIDEAVVAPFEASPGNSILVGYYMLAGTAQEDGQLHSQLKDYLKDALPDYMVPAAFLAIDNIPLSPNGKVNRDKLPRPDLTALSTSSYEAPRNATEQALADIWQHVLEREQIGIHDDFFDIGGHSLLASRVAARIKTHFQLELKLRDLFDATTVATLAEKIAQVEKSDQAQLPAIEAAPRHSDSTLFPLSITQKRLWFIANLIKDSATYNMPTGLRIEGAIDRSRLSASLQILLQRHEALRSSFHHNDMEGQQQIHSALTLTLEQDSIANDEAAIKNAAMEFALRPFDLGKAPLIRAKLLSLEDETHILLLCVHHIIADGWSLDIIINDLLALYLGNEQQLPTLDIQYADYALWQQQHLGDEYFAPQLDYWREQLDQLPKLELPTDFPRPSQLSAEGKGINFSLDASLATRLRKFCLEHQVTPYVVLLSCYQTLLYRYTGQHDFGIGTPVANRPQTELESIVGFFVNTLVLRTAITEDESFSSLQQRVKQTLLRAQQHLDVPFEQLVSELVKERDIAQTPLFQTSFSYQVSNSQSREISAKGISIKPLWDQSSVYDIPVKFDLQCSFTDGGEGQAMQGTIEGRTALFRLETLQQLQAHFLNLLDTVLAEPEQKLARLPILSAAERQKILHDWNDTRVNRLHVDSIQQLFERQVERTPDAIALRYNEALLSYRQLNQQANQLAHLLQSMGVKADSMVGVCMERSPQMSVALLAILKAGGAYVPFDPTFPADRLQYMLEDTEATIMLTQSHLQERLPAGVQHVLLVDTESHRWASMKQDNPALACQADNLFNVIFTSGSTGKPKGVMVPHKGIINRLLWMQNAYPLDSSDRILQKTPYSFDVSVWELFWPLIIGAELVYAKPEGHKEADYLRDTINKYNISTLHFVPTMLGIFLQTADIENCSSIKRVFCSGEALQLEHEKRFFQRLDKSELHNLYGPTEASVDVSYFACRPDSNYSSVPIGKPVSNTQLYVLDKHLAPVPVGVVGELYIGGIQLARGYLKREELSRETFIDNPFLTEAWAAEANLSDKLYKTGDLTRYLPDGNIEYIGRVDFQVKVRGLRIELGEIENVLHQHPSIGETLVITKDLGAGNVIIAAYCVPKGEAPDIAALRQFLAQHLPNYMIPNAFIMLDRIPISANGKADRKALPDPTSACSVSTEYVAPGNSTERKLAQIWTETLGVEKIGIHDNFFELGGHSVLAMQIANKALAHFEVELELIKLFENPTIAAIAEMIEGKLAEQQLLMNDEAGDDDEELVI